MKFRVARVVVSVALSGLAGVACGGSQPSEPAPPPGPAPPAAASPAPAPSPTAAAEPPKPKQCTDACSSLLKTGFEELKKADGLAGAEGAEGMYTKAGESLEKAWRGCLLTAPSGADAQCEQAGMVTAEMARAYSKANQPMKHVTAALAVLDRRWASPESAKETARGSLDKLIQDEKADPAARVLALIALDRVDEVEAAASKLLLPTTKTEHADLGLLAAAEFFLEEKDTKKASKLVPPHKKPKDPAQQIVWSSLRARVALNSNNMAAAQRDAEAALKLFADASDKTALLGAQAPRPMLGREAVMDALGAAYYVRGKALIPPAERAKAPAYYGKPTDADVAKFVDGQLKPWLTKRQPLVEAAVKEFDAIAQLQPVPPERWVMHGSAESAKLWGAFADEAVAIAESPALKKDEAVAANFKKQLEGMVKSARDTQQKHSAQCKALAEKQPAGAEAPCQ